MISKLLVSSLCVFIVSHSFATSVDVFGAKTSDDIELDYLEVSSQYKSFSLQARVSETSFSKKYGSIYSLGGNYDLKVTETQSVSLGADIKDVDLNERHHVRPYFSGNYKFTGKWALLSIGGEQRLPGETLSVTQVSFIDLREDELFYSLTLRPVDYLRFISSQYYSWTADNNEKFSADTALFYGISKGWPWIWIGYGYSTLNYQKNSHGYWSPDRFWAHGFRLDASFPVVDKLSGILAINLNKYNEDGFKGDGYFAVAGVQWGASSKDHIKLMWTQIKSGQSNSPWVYNSLNLKATYSF